MTVNVRSYFDRLGLHCDVQLNGAAEMLSIPSNSQTVDEPLLDAKQVAVWLSVSEDWVWDHSTRRAPFLPAIWLSDGAIRFKRSAISAFITEREHLSRFRPKRRN
jgi:predicted DNA-binding transcriptional regulator AlpA